VDCACFGRVNSLLRKKQFVAAAVALILLPGLNLPASVLSVWLPAILRLKVRGASEIVAFE
jgi:hypothetical protein